MFVTIASTSGGGRTGTTGTCGIDTRDWQRKDSNVKDIYEMACDVVNPDGGRLNETQENEVQALVSFAESVLKEFQLDGAWVTVNESGEITCKVCGRGIEKKRLQNIATP